MSAGRDARLERVLVCLDGLSVGDAFGDCFFGYLDEVLPRLRARILPEAPWAWSDDTAMATGVVEMLAQAGHIDPDRLAAVFARRFVEDPARGYGHGAYQILSDIAAGGSWRDLAPASFRGTGSYGNGAAMRAAPIGAWFAGEPRRAAEEAGLSAIVTHAHPEGIAGAVAVAIASSIAAGDQEVGDGPPRPGTLLPRVIEHVAPGAVRDGITRAAELGDISVEAAAGILGTGERVSAADTVPFALWCADRHLDDYVQALWTVVSGLGDRDTTAAITGGVVGAAVGRAGIPPTWVGMRESLRLDGIVGRE
jgi:ADP-ribosylglycohydrolase